jgi:ATP-dependent Lon protease
VTASELPKLLKRRKFHEDEREVTSNTGHRHGLGLDPVGGDVLYVEASDVARVGAASCSPASSAT